MFGIRWDPNQDESHYLIDEPTENYQPAVSSLCFVEFCLASAVTFGSVCFQAGQTLEVTKQFKYTAVLWFIYSYLVM